MVRAVLFGLLAGFGCAIALLVPGLRLVFCAFGVVLGVLAIVWFGRRGDEGAEESPLGEEIASVRRAQRR